MKSIFFTISLVLVTLVACNSSKQDDSPNADKTKSAQKDTTSIVEEHPGVYFINLHDSEKVKSPLIVQMGVVGMMVEPAGQIRKDMGHHHLIIDGTFTEKGQMVPKDATHLHFGKGQTIDTLQLAPGNHTLTLQFANGAHESYGKEWSKTISVFVSK